MIVREATLNDAAAIAQVHVDTWRTTYRGTVPDDYLDQLSYKQRQQIWAGILSAPSSDHFTYVAEDEIGQIVGFADGGLERTGNCTRSKICWPQGSAKAAGVKRTRSGIQSREDCGLAKALGKS